MNYPKNRYSKNKEHPWLDYDWLYEKYIVQRMRTEDIAALYGCKPSTIERAAFDHNLHRDRVECVRKNKKPYEDPDILRKLYIDEQKTMTEIGEIFGCSGDTIRVHLKKNNIPVRPYFQPRPLKDVDLNELYTNQRMSSTEIAERYGISHRTVLSELKRQGVPARSLSDSQFASKNLERNSLLNSKEWLYEEYITKRRSVKDIAIELGHSTRVVKDALRSFGIPTRGCSESKIGINTGSKHPNWQNGKTPLDALCREYFQINIATKAAKRDGYTCQKCGKTHCILHVHHKIPFMHVVNSIIKDHPEIDQTKDGWQELMYPYVVNDDRFTSLDNLITYCVKCHKEEHKKYNLRKKDKNTMKLKTYVDESCEYYKYPVLLIATTTCDFKCCVESGIPIAVCQNEPWLNKPTYEIPNIMLIQTYNNNPITKAICFAGFEPFKQFEEVKTFISEFRETNDDPVILYTGYYKSEIEDKIEQLQKFSNIIVKFGRFKPNEPHHTDPILGVELASTNQYAEKIS